MLEEKSDVGTFRRPAQPLEIYEFGTPNAAAAQGS